MVHSVDLSELVTDDRGYDREVLTNLLFCSQNSTESHTSSTQNPPGITSAQTSPSTMSEKVEDSNQDECTGNGKELMSLAGNAGDMLADVSICRRFGPDMRIGADLVSRHLFK